MLALWKPTKGKERIRRIRQSNQLPNLNRQHHVFGNRLHVHRHRKMERTDERREESQLSPSGQENQERIAQTLHRPVTRRLQPLVWPVPADTHPLYSCP